MARVFWRSWSDLSAAYDIERIKRLNLRHEWTSGHLTPGTYHRPGDIWLTGNGYDNIDTPCVKATVYAEPYVYLRCEYDNFAQNKSWDMRFVYDPDLLEHDKTVLLPIAGYWDCDGKIRKMGERHWTFGMVLGHKPPVDCPGYIGHIRSEFVEALRGKSFAYWGPGWDASDPNWHREVYLTGNKFRDSQSLWGKCEFALVIENSLIPGYHTEKFWNAIIAGCLPVYYGCHTMRNMAPPEVYINGYEFGSVDDVIKYCESMSDEEWRRRVKHGTDMLLADRTHSWEAVFEQIDRSL